MELDEDTHLCLRCGRTIEGLDNYVTHRQQMCQNFNQTSVSPFLSDTSVSLTPTESPAEEPSHHDPHRDLYKLSADDFFLNLNLQSNFKSVDSRNDMSCESNTNQSLATESFCPRLDIPTLETDLGSSFPEDKPLCSDSIVDETNCLGIVLSNEKWESFKDRSNLCPTTHPHTKNGLISVNDEKKNFLQIQSLSSISNLKENLSTDTVVAEKAFKRRKKKTAKEYGFTDFSVMHVPRTSYRQKLHANGSLMCCQEKQKFYQCLVCKVKFAFASTLLDHLLLCKKKSRDTSAWRSEIFNNELLFVRSSQFRCLVCSFHNGDSFSFLNHLKSRDHLRNAASLKNPLICLPCQDEFCASDEMREHFAKNHLQYKKEDHPIIIAEKKRNLHCCFCLTVVKSSSHLESSGNLDVLCKEDVNFIRDSLPLITTCAFGVEKQKYNMCVSTLNSLISSENVEPSALTVSPPKSNKPAVPAESPNSAAVKPAKSPKPNSNPKPAEYVISNIQSENEEQLPKISLKRLKDFPPQHGKLIIKKSKRGNFKKIWSCNMCSSQHLSKLSLRRHFEVCSRKSEEDSKSSESKTVPPEPKKYLCHICGYVGKCFNQLTRHCRSHTGEKPYQCDHCSYTSSLSSKMVRHKRLHTGLKPYKCPHCDYCCNTQENLRKHILKTKKHQGKMMYPCPHCDYECNEYTEYKDHISKLHTEDST